MSPSPHAPTQAYSLAFALALATGVGTPLPTPAAGPVVLNEILASNQKAVPVGIRFPDYVELLNTSASTVTLTGATLADDSATILPFSFPAGTTLAPGAKLTVWCDQIPGLPSPQALFGIGATGDRLQLRGPDGTLWDETQIGLQIPDLAVGRVPDGTGSWQLAPPSPGSANTALTLATPTALRVNEWMASPDTGDDWLELHNTAAQPVELSGLTLTDRSTLPPTNRPIPALSFIPAGGFVQFFASDLRRSEADHLDFRLGAGGDQILLLATNRSTVIDQIAFGTQQPGVSQGRAPDGGETIVDFPADQATPGARNIRELTRVVISEILSHTDPPFEDAIELHNPTQTAVDISHWWVSDEASTPRKYRLPAGTILAAGGYLALYEGFFGAGSSGFSLNSYEGDEVWLSTGDATGNLTGERAVARFGPLPNGTPAGRVTLSNGTDFAPLERPSFGVDFPASVGQFRQGTGAPNALPTVSPIRIAEIHHSPSPDATGGIAEPFIELLNPGTLAEPLFDTEHPTNAWRLRGAARFDLPTGLTLDPKSRLLITAFNPQTDPDRLAAFRTAHRIPASIPILGPFTGNLANPSSGLELQYPDTPEGPTKPRPGLVPYVRAERVEYSFEIPWPTPGANSGLALRRTSPDAFSNDPASWSAAIASPGRAEPDTTPADTDSDGMPDAWETAHGLDPRNAADAATDPDSDGATNLAEYLADTDPRNRASVLRLSATPLATDAAPSRLVLAFTPRPGRAYVIESRYASEAAWTTHTEVPASAEPAPFQTAIPAPGEPRWFRIRLVQTP